MASIENLEQTTAIVKIGEIVLQIVAIGTFFGGLHYGSSFRPLDGWQLYGSSVILGSFINAVVLLVLCLYDYRQIQQTPLEMLLCTYYALAYFITAILLMVYNMGTVLAAGVFCLLLSFVYLFDLYLAYNLLVGRNISFPSFPTPPGQGDPCQNPPNMTGLPTPPSATSPYPAPSEVYQVSQPIPSPASASPVGSDLPPYLTPSYKYTSGGSLEPEDTVDRDRLASLYNTNPVYPATLNYPPSIPDDDIPVYATPKP